MSVLDLHTLNDCGCIAKVYSDGSGVDIEYCKLHQAAPKLLHALGWLYIEADSNYLFGEDQLELDALENAQSVLTAAGWVYSR